VAADRRAPLLEGEALDIALRCGSALEVVHESGVLHRDLSPSNVMLSTSGRVVLIDFGLARDYLVEETAHMTRMVTPGYAPPEQYTASGRFGPSTDVYGLAAILYRMLAGRAPTPAIDRQSGAPLPAPRSLNPNISRLVSDGILDGLELNSEHRPTSVRDFLGRLNLTPADATEHSAPVGLTAAAPSSGAKVIPVAPPGQRPPPPPSPSDRPARPPRVITPTPFPVVPPSQMPAAANPGPWPPPQPAPPRPTPPAPGIWLNLPHAASIGRPSPAEPGPQPAAPVGGGAGANAVGSPASPGGGVATPDPSAAGAGAGAASVAGSPAAGPGGKAGPHLLAPPVGPGAGASQANPPEPLAAGPLPAAGKPAGVVGPWAAPESAGGPGAGAHSLAGVVGAPSAGDDGGAAPTYAANPQGRPMSVANAGTVFSEPARWDDQRPGAGQRPVAGGQDGLPVPPVVAPTVAGTAAWPAPAARFAPPAGSPIPSVPVRPVMGGQPAPVPPPEAQGAPVLGGFASWKLSLPAGAVVAAAGAMVPVIAWALLTLVVMPALATAGDASLYLHYNRMGATMPWKRRMGLPFYLLARFCRNAMAVLHSTISAMVLGAGLIVATLVAQGLGVDRRPQEVVLRLGGAGVALLVARPVVTDRWKFRASIIVDSAFRRCMSGNSLTITGWWVWFAAFVSVLLAVGLRPETFPLH
jgi:hypothetical protein